MKRILSLLLCLAMMMACVSALAEGAAIPRLEDLDLNTAVIDPEHPLGPQFTGLYSFDVALEGGATRPVYHYVPTSLTYRQPAVAIGVPSGEDALSFAEATGWKAIADEQGFSLILMVAGEGGWTAEDAAYVNGCFTYMDDRTYLQMQDSAFYMVGYGDSANLVMGHAVDNSEFLAGAAAFGVDSFDTALLDAARAAESNEAGTMKSQVALPIWFAVENADAAATLVDYWKNANDLANAAVYSNEYADQVYLHRRELALDNDLTDQNVASVRVTYGTDRVQSAAFTQELWNNFLRRVRRQDSAPINSLRAFATNLELGMEYQTTVVNGTTREFYIYVPTAVKSGKVQNVPVVIVFHGGGGSGEEFSNRSGWHRVAEERQFIAVFPTGCRGNAKLKASSSWNDNDFPFYQAVRSYVLDNYSVDESRVYIIGHSQGTAIVSYIALHAPETIAAAIINDAGRDTRGEEGANYDIVMPVMVNVGDLDKYFVEGGFQYGTVPTIMEGWYDRYGKNKLGDETYTYQNGRYYGHVWTNVDNIPVVQEQWETGKIHALIPEEVYRQYDFMANYSRGADGTSYYMGQEIKLK